MEALRIEETQNEQLQKKLQDTINTVFKAGITYTDHRPESQTILKDRITSIIAHMQDLDQLPFQDFPIPLNVIECVDAGVNPDLLRKDQVQLIVDKNQKTTGRLKSIAMFRDELQLQMSAHFPDLVSKSTWL